MWNSTEPEAGSASRTCGLRKGGSAGTGVFVGRGGAVGDGVGSATVLVALGAGVEVADSACGALQPATTTIRAMRRNLDRFFMHAFERMFLACMIPASRHL